MTTTDKEEPSGEFKVNEAAAGKRFDFDFLKRFNVDRLSNLHFYFEAVSDAIGNVAMGGNVGRVERCTSNVEKKSRIRLDNTACFDFALNLFGASNNSQRSDHLKPPSHLIGEYADIIIISKI